MDSFYHHAPHPGNSQRTTTTTKKKEATVSKTATAKNLNKTLSKPKPLSPIEKAVAVMRKAMQAIPKAQVLEVPDVAKLEKTSTKAQLAAQVAELTKSLNAASISIEKLGISNVRYMHLEKLALKKLADEKKKAKEAK